jgi:transcriptional regulator with XRE-family HTH domain
MKEKTILRKFAKRIKELRKLKKMSQEQLAEKAGLHPTFIGNLERAEKNPTITSLAKIARALNISLSELLTFPDDKKIVDATAKDMDKLVEFVKDALDLAKGYKAEKKTKSDFP